MYSVPFFNPFGTENPFIKGNPFADYFRQGVGDGHPQRRARDEHDAEGYGGWNRQY